MSRLAIFAAGERLPADYWTAPRPGTRATEIEVGPGDGRFLIEAARRDPTTVFVGFELRTASARRLAEHPDLPVNAAVHAVDARWVIENLVADASVQAFHIYFPDPWWKKRHHKRRLFTASFAAALARCLSAGGAVYLVSDVERVFREAAELLVAAGLEEQPWTRASEDAAQSSYERKYRRQGRRLWQARFVKAPAPTRPA